MRQIWRVSPERVTAFSPREKEASAGKKIPVKDRWNAIGSRRKLAVRPGHLSGLRNASENRWDVRRGSRTVRAPGVTGRAGSRLISFNGASGLSKVIVRSATSSATEIAGSFLVRPSPRATRMVPVTGLPVGCRPAPVPPPRRSRRCGRPAPKRVLRASARKPPGSVGKGSVAGAATVVARRAGRRRRATRGRRGRWRALRTRSGGPDGDRPVRVHERHRSDRSGPALRSTPGRDERLAESSPITERRVA